MIYLIYNVFMKKSLILSLFLIGCSTPTEYTLKPNQKFVDGEVRMGRLKIETRQSQKIEEPEIVLFNDGQGGEFTIREK